MTRVEGTRSRDAPAKVAVERRPRRIGDVLEVIRLSYFAWVPTVASIAIGVGFLVTYEPIYFVLSTLVGFIAGLGWAVWFNVDR